MSKADEPFLTRWSRRKSEARESTPAVEQPESEEKGSDTALLSEEHRAEGPQRAPMPEGHGKDVLKRVLTEADFAEMAGMEFLLIDEHTTVAGFKKELRWNDLYYHLAKGL